jgi:hypothetical protein
MGQRIRVRHEVALSIPPRLESVPKPKTGRFNGTDGADIGFLKGAFPIHAPRGCPVKQTTSQEPDQVNVLLLLSLIPSCGSWTLGFEIDPVGFP